MPSNNLDGCIRKPLVLGNKLTVVIQRFLKPHLWLDCSKYYWTVNEWGSVNRMYVLFDVELEFLLWSARPDGKNLILFERHLTKKFKQNVFLWFVCATCHAWWDLGPKFVLVLWLCCIGGKDWGCTVTLFTTFFSFRRENSKCSVVRWSLLCVFFRHPFHGQLAMSDVKLRIAQWVNSIDDYICWNK